MFGYIRPLQEELKVRDLRTWKQDYCGLCHCLGKRYGFASRFLLRYDLTFLYSFLTMASSPGETERHWCPAGVVCRKACRQQDAAMEYVADLTILLMWGKLEDETNDGGFLRRCAAGIGRVLFRRAYRKAARFRPEMDLLIRDQLQKLHALEQEKSDSIDRTADAFASILRGSAGWIRDETERRPAEQALYQIGRYVYLVDALDDLPRDCRRNAYNPLRYRFTPHNGALTEEDQSYLLQTMDASVDLAAAAFELMHRSRRGAVVENIIYYGLPAVLRAVSEGKFDRRKKQVKI